MNPCNAKKCKSIKLCELRVCVCVLVLGHSHSALKSRQLTAHTTGNARAPARAASQDCSAWEPTQRGRILRFTFYGQSESRRVQHLFSALLLLLFAVVCCCCCCWCCYCWHWAWEFVASLALSFGARVARLESERSVDCSLWVTSGKFYDCTGRSSAALCGTSPSTSLTSWP